MSFQVLFLKIGNRKRFETDAKRFETLKDAATYGVKVVRMSNKETFKVIDSNDPVTDWADGRQFSVNGVILGGVYECDGDGKPFDELHDPFYELSN